MHSTPTLVCPAASSVGSPALFCGRSHSCRAVGNRYIGSNPAYSQRRVDVTMDHAIATSLFLITSMQPFCFHAIANSSPQRGFAIRCPFNNLRTLSNAIGGGALLPFTAFDHSLISPLTPVA